MVAHLDILYVSGDRKCQNQYPHLFLNSKITTSIGRSAHAASTIDLNEAVCAFMGLETQI